MYHIRFSILLFCPLFLLFATGCTKPVEYEFENDGPRLGLSAKIDPRSGFEAFLSSSIAPGMSRSLESLWISDATLTLITDGGQAYPVPAVGQGRYLLPNTAIVDFNERFGVEITHPDFPSVTSDWVSIPAAVISPQLLRTPPNTNDPEMDTWTHTITAGDPEGDTYYYVEVYPTNRPAYQFQLSVNAAFRLEACDYYNYHPPYGIFFSDVCVVGQRFTMDLMPELNNRAFDVGEELFYTDYEVALRSISSVYYEFQLDRLNLDREEGTIVEARPSAFNIQGGYGFFVASNSFVRRFQRP